MTQIFPSTSVAFHTSHLTMQVGRWLSYISTYLYRMRARRNRVSSLGGRSSIWPKGEQVRLTPYFTFHTPVKSLEKSAQPLWTHIYIHPPAPLSLPSACVRKSEPTRTHPIFLYRRNFKNPLYMPTLHTYIKDLYMLNFHNVNQDAQADGPYRGTT